MTIIVPVFRSSIAILIAYVSFLNKAYTEDDLREYIKESVLLKMLISLIIVLCAGLFM